MAELVVTTAPFLFDRQTGLNQIFIGDSFFSRLFRQIVPAIQRQSKLPFFGHVLADLTSGEIISGCGALLGIP